MKKIIAGVAITLAANSGFASNSTALCNNLADIGGNTVNARNAGYTLSDILGVAAKAWGAGQRELLAKGEGVVIAVYGDSSLRTYDQGYNAVFQACIRS